MKLDVQVVVNDPKALRRLPPVYARVKEEATSRFNYSFVHVMLSRRSANDTRQDSRSKERVHDARISISGLGKRLSPRVCNLFLSPLFLMTASSEPLNTVRRVIFVGCNTTFTRGDFHTNYGT